MDDNVQMAATRTGLSAWRPRDRARGVVAFLRQSQPPRPLSGWSLAADAVLAVAATVAAIMEVTARTRGLVAAIPKGTVFTPVITDLDGVRRVIGYAAVSHGTLIGILKAPLQDLPPPPGPSATVLLAVALTAAPLAGRRRYPAAACCVIMAAVLASRDWTPPVTFATAIFAAYSAVVYSKYRQLALGVVLTGAVIITMTFPNTLPRVSERYTAILVVIPVVAAGIAMREWRRRVSDSAARLRRAEAEHEAATRRAVETERSRIASELHDVVTHNVSVMVVQAGAARQVLASSPGDATQALLAVEASGRTAMAELRHLLGLLCPVDDDAALRPQPGLGQLDSLIRRVSDAGLPVDLHTSGPPHGLPPGPDLAAYRIVQEGLTNVIKHAGQAPASVRLEYHRGELVITVTDDGGGTGGPGRGGGGGGTEGGGVLGLRERLAVYGGDLSAGPRPGGGWRLRARIPLCASGASEPGGPVSGVHVATV